MLQTVSKQSNYFCFHFGPRQRILIKKSMGAPNAYLVTLVLIN